MQQQEHHHCHHHQLPLTDRLVDHRSDKAPPGSVERSQGRRVRWGKRPRRVSALDGQALPEGLQVRTCLVLPWGSCAGKGGETKDKRTLEVHTTMRERFLARVPPAQVCPPSSPTGARAQLVVAKSPGTGSVATKPDLHGEDRPQASASGSTAAVVSPIYVVPPQDPFKGSSHPVSARDGLTSYAAGLNALFFHGTGRQKGLGSSVPPTFAGFCLRAQRPEESHVDLHWAERLALAFSVSQRTCIRTTSHC